MFLILATAACPMAVAGDDRISAQDAGYTFHYFSDSDDIRVFSQYSDYEVEFENEAKIFLEWNHEQLVMPPVAAPVSTDESVDAITSASRPIASDEDAFKEFRKTRDQVRASATHNWIDAGYYASMEEDYFAQQISGSMNRDFVSQTTNLALGGSYGWDKIEPLADQDTPGHDESKNNRHINVVLTQVLTPTTVVRIGAEANLVRGLQHSPYRNVYAAGGHQPERHPDRRDRHDLFVKLNQHIGGNASVQLGYKYYSDDWGVDSHTLGARLNQHVGRAVTVSWRYRFYDQTAATFWREEYADTNGVDGYLSDDYRLGEFDAHLFGSRIAWDIGSLLGSAGEVIHPQLVTLYERYFNSNNFSANIFESGIAVGF